MKWMLAGLLLLALPCAAPAAVFCVSNASELQQALSAAAASAADDEIRLRAGVYVHTQPLLYQSSTAGWVYLSGGWREANANACGAQDLVASATVLDGEGVRQILLMAFSPPANSPIVPRYLVSNLTFRNGKAPEFGRGGGLNMFSAVDLYQEYWIDNVIFHDNEGYFAGGAEFYLQRGLLRVVNSLFHGNRAPTSAFAHFNVTLISGDATHDVIVANSTFVDGACPGSGGRGCGIGAGLGGTVRMDVLNSLFWGNGISDANIEGLTAGGFGSGTVFYDFSRVPISSGTLTPTITNASTLDPRFVDPDAADWRLRDDSPFIDRGRAPIPLYGNLSSDIAGAPRVRFGAQDAGALENQTQTLLYRDGFEAAP